MVLNYKGVKTNSFGIPIWLLDKDKRIKKKNRKKRFYNLNFQSKFTTSSPKNLIVMYDVPHEMKNERDWLRRQLVSFGYIMIQKSVWVGPSPLPRDFLDYLKAVGFKNKLKSFKLANAYTGIEKIFD